MGRERELNRARRGHWPLGVVSAVLGLGGVWNIYSSSGFGMYGAVACVAASVVCAGVVTVLRRRQITRIHALQRRACLNCGYDLRPFGAAGRCPECGEVFDIRHTVSRWLDVVADLEQADIDPD